MKRVVECEDRRQGVLLPEYLDDFVSAENPVRVIDVFVDELDLWRWALRGLCRSGPEARAYHPSIMLKLFIYGYLNQVQSSRRLEREAQRNVEVMWLTGRIAPDFKTIADFRRDNGAGIRATCRQFVLLCQELKLFAHAVAAIDGSKFKASNSRDRNWTPTKLTRRMEQIEASIERYMSALETADRQDGGIAEGRAVRIKEKIKVLRERMAELPTLEPIVSGAPDRQVSLTDPDARAMATSSRTSGLVGYNVQAAVDAKHHLIVAHEVTNQGYDRGQLAPMAERAKAAMGVDAPDVLADRGYFAGEQVMACEAMQVTPYVPKPLTSGAKAQGQFGNRTSSICPRRTPIVAPLGRRCLGTLRLWRTASPCTATGTCSAVGLAPSKTAAHRARNDGFRVGSTRR